MKGSPFTTATQRARRKLTAVLTSLIVVFTINTSFAQVVQPDSESDSSIIARHLHEMKVEYALAEFSDHSFNAGYSDQQLDSILAEMRITILCGRVLYAPDSTFRIVVAEGEGCGSHCHKIYKSWLHFNDGSGMVLPNAGFENVTAIEKLHDGKYLVWEQRVGIIQEHGMNEMAVTLLSVNGHAANFTPFPAPPSRQDDESKNPNGAFRLYQVFDDSVTLVMDFHPETNELSYRYLHYNFSGNPDDMIIYSGSFGYTNGAFILKEETSKPYTE